MNSFRILVLLVMFSTGPVVGAATVYSTEAEFLAAVSPTDIENFEDEALTQQVTSLSTDLLSVTTTPLDGGSAYILIAEFGSPNSLHETDGSKYLNAGSVTFDSWRHDFTLIAPATALAFELTDAFEREVAGGGLSMVKLTLGNGHEFVLGTCPPCEETGNEFFFGVSTPGEPFSTFSLTNTAWADGIGYDRIQLVLAASIEVDVDIKPGSDPNCLNVNGKGVIPVSILGSEIFDVTQIDQQTLYFAGLQVRVRGQNSQLCSVENSNDDPYPDLVCQFQDDPSMWTPGEGYAEIIGNLVDGSTIVGSDAICVVP